MCSESYRQELRAAQTTVVEAVLRGGDYPPGFESRRLDIAHDGVSRKRAWAVTGAWPGMARSLGPDYLNLFREYVSREQQFPPPGGSLLDGLWFSSYLARAGRLPDLGRVQALSFRLHYRERERGVVPRRGPALRLTVLRKPPYLLVGVRARQVHLWRIPLAGRRIR